jgi:hypothetical protein
MPPSRSVPATNMFHLQLVQLCAIFFLSQCLFWRVGVIRDSRSMGRDVSAFKDRGWDGGFSYLEHIHLLLTLCLIQYNFFLLLQQDLHLWLWGEGSLHRLSLEFSLPLNTLVSQESRWDCLEGWGLLQLLIDSPILSHNGGGKEWWQVRDLEISDLKVKNIVVYD